MYLDPVFLKRWIRIQLSEVMDPDSVSLKWWIRILFFWSDGYWFCSSEVMDPDPVSLKGWIMIRFFWMIIIVMDPDPFSPKRWIKILFFQSDESGSCFSEELGPDLFLRRVESWSGFSEGLFPDPIFFGDMDPDPQLWCQAISFGFN